MTPEQKHLNQMPNETIGSETIVGIATSIVLALVTAVAYLWRRIDKKSEETETRLNDKLEECEEKHQTATSKLIEISREVGELKGEMKGIRELSGKVLSEIHGRSDNNS